MDFEFFGLGIMEIIAVCITVVGLMQLLKNFFKTLSSQVSALIMVGVTIVVVLCAVFLPLVVLILFVIAFIQLGYETFIQFPKKLTEKILNK